MISVDRMQWDVLTQWGLLSATIVLLTNGSGNWWWLPFTALYLWQLASALQLIIQFDYKARWNWIKIVAVWLLVIALSGPWLQQLILLLPALLYFFYSLRDWTILKNRGRSFWDL